MAKILYITPDIYKLGKRGGGMGTKTKSMQKAWADQHEFHIASELDTELVNSYDVILIELLGFRKKKSYEGRIESLKESDTPKLVYGSDSEIFRWPGKQLEELKSLATGWIANCHWQMNYFMDFDLPVFGIVYEPIDTDLFRPSESKEKTIVTGGMVSHEKEAEFFIELFTKLKPIQKDFKTEWIGSAGGWNDYQPKNLRLEHELKSVTDNFYGQKKPSEVASIMGKSGIAVFNPRYETCHRMGMEIAASGTARICGSHILYDEKATAGRFETVDQCIELLSELTNEFTELPDKTHGIESREFALSNYSYQATLKQLNTFLGYVI